MPRFGAFCSSKRRLPLYFSQFPLYKKIGGSSFAIFQLAQSVLNGWPQMCFNVSRHFNTRKVNLCRFATRENRLWRLRVANEKRNKHTGTKHRHSKFFSLYEQTNIKQPHTAVFVGFIVWYLFLVHSPYSLGANWNYAKFIKKIRCNKRIVNSKKKTMQNWFRLATSTEDCLMVL